MNGFSLFSILFPLLFVFRHHRHRAKKQKNKAKAQTQPRRRRGRDGSTSHVTFLITDEMEEEERSEVLLGLVTFVTVVFEIFD
jgi:hypothetical protein